MTRPKRTWHNRCAWQGPLSRAVPFVLAALFLLPGAARSVRLPDELQPLSAEWYTFDERLAVTPDTPARVAIHSNGGEVDLSVRLVRSGSDVPDTLLIWEATEITPREEIDRWVATGDGPARYDGISMLPGIHYIGIELAAGSAGGIYEVSLRCRLDGALVNLQAGHTEASATAIAVGDVRNHSAKVEWFGRATIPELVGRKTFQGSFSSADRLASSQGGWGLVLPRELSAKLPRFRDSRGMKVSVVTSPDRLTEEELALGAVWLAGDPASNHWMRDALEKIGTVVTPEGYRLADGRTAGEGVLDCVISNPWAPDLPMRLTVAPTLEEIESCRPIERYPAADPSLVLDNTVHHTAVTNGESLVFLDGNVPLGDSPDDLLYRLGASDGTGTVYARSFRDPGIWNTRFQMVSEQPLLSLSNLSGRWDLRLEHFFIVWDGGVVSAVAAGPRPYAIGETAAVISTPPWNTRYDVTVKVAMPREATDLDKIRVNAVPYADVGGEWAVRGDTVWGVLVADDPGKMRLRFLRDGEISRWTINLENANGTDTVYISSDWRQEREKTLRYIPYIMGRAIRYAGNHRYAVGGLAILFGSIAAFAITIHRKERRKTSILSELKEELNRAREIQRSLFPSTALRADRVEISGVCRSMQEVGGDYYDYFTLPDGTALFTIADVAGHGYAAALRMSGIHYHLHRGGFDCNRPGTILTEINRNLAAAGRPSEFVTGFLACLSPDRSQLSWASAGHPGAILVRGDGGIETLTSTGLPLGVLSEAAYEEKTVTIGPNDLVVAFTDGILEATNGSDEEFGEHRVRSVLRDHGERDFPSLFEALFRTVARFSGTDAQEDDMAVIAARVAHAGSGTIN